MSNLPALAVAAVVSMITMSVAVPAAPRTGVAPTPTVDAEQPLLSIAIDNGRTSAAAGDELTYKITIRNLGTTEAKGLEISQSLPAGLTFAAADNGGTADADRVVWPTDLKTGQEATFTTVARLGQTPDELLRLATVACATADGAEKPLVCATHSDLLPAGAVATRTEEKAVTPWMRYGAAAAALAVLALVTTVLLRRRRRRLLAARPEAGTGRHLARASVAD
ncbi:hypothetical protein [Micromonospora sp. NBC_01796]|uniref:hypothetical protein n=1 Tax=Micromonospora sp. NBC_01796 TaxID=2975987 RepID=UPI002DD7BAEE|nr:hypothetical protein [Micromonospora sp. NBC_01796]WSA83388.1 DUF11 domain-containing protein [Micromonospora sp. NBC_01796]